MRKYANMLPPLPEDERIYLCVQYPARDFARASHCGFDGKKKLWFTGVENRNLLVLIKMYGVDTATSEKAKELLREKLGM